MTNRNRKPNDIFQALAGSPGRPDFPFDREEVRARLMRSIAAQPQAARPSWLRRFVPAIALGAAAFGLILAASSTMTYASEAVPGDELYFLSAFQEKLVLALPLPADQKADLRFGFAYKHLSEVSEVQDKSKEVQIKTLERSQEFVKQTVDQAVSAEQSLRKKGQTRSAESLSRDLSDFRTIADEHVERLEKLRENEPMDTELSKKIDEHLAEIKNARQKAGQELKNELQEKVKGIKKQN